MFIFMYYFIYVLKYITNTIPIFNITLLFHSEIIENSEPLYLLYIYQTENRKMKIYIYNSLKIINVKIRIIKIRMINFK